MWLKTFRSIFEAAVRQSGPAPAGCPASLLHSPGPGGTRGGSGETATCPGPRQALILGEPVDGGGGGARGRGFLLAAVPLCLI